MTLYIRIAIHYGHPYLLTLAPFREAIQRYPKSLTLWEHYIRFIAIYPEENIALMTAIEEVKTRFPSSKIMKTIRLLSTTLLQSRNKHMSSSLKRKLKQFDESNRQIKSIMISFWTAISENGSIAAYDIAKQVIQQRDELKSQYSQTFYEQFMGKELLFIKFLEMEVVNGVPESFPESWRYIRKELHSLQRHTNLNIYFKENPVL